MTEEGHATPAPDLEALAEAYEAGLAAERAGDRQGAVAAYHRALALDPEDRGGVAVRLAALGAGGTPERAPPAYVEMLFDQHAERFDEMLVEQLGYSVPVQIRELLEHLAIAPAERLLDLGCGTGLSGQSLADRAAHLTGVDLSEAMLDEAHAKGVYDALYVGDATAFLEETDEPAWDLVVATDMVPYLGDLAAFAAGLARCCAPGGHVAFSTETLPGEAIGGAGYRVGPKHRFAHAEVYVRALVQGVGFRIRAFERIVVRHDEGAPVPGHLVVARKEA